MIGQLGQMLVSAGDVFVATRYSTESVASIGVASGVINPIFLFGIGLMMGVSPSLAMSRGEGTDDKETLFSIIIYALLVGGSLTILTLIANEFVPYFGFDPSLVPSIQQYISIVSWSFPFALLFQGIKEFLQAYDEVFMPNMLALGSVVLNLIINFILVFGFAGFGGIGEVGLAYASLAIRIILAGTILLLVWSKLSNLNFDKLLVLNIFKFSLPIAFMFFLEVLAFCTVTILSGVLGVTEAATNNIIMTLASIAFMIPLSISSAVSVKVGNAYGRKSLHDVRRYTQSSLIIVLSFVGCSASFFFFFPEQVMGLLSKDFDVIQLGIKLLLIVAIFQLFDGFQVLLTGVLRGLNSTHISSALVFMGYWLIGIPIGIYLAFYTDIGAEGLWIGLALSLSIVATLMAIFTMYRFRKLSFNPEGDYENN